MAGLAVVVDTSELKAVADGISRINASTLGAAAVRGINTATTVIYDESRRRMIARVNLRDDYVQDRMAVEPANDPRKPEAVIAALRTGGKRRPGLRPTNLRQYAAQQITAPVRFPNSDPRIARGDWGRNPRADDKWLKWKKRTGYPARGIPVGQKQAGISVEVLKGSRKPLENAFMQRMRNGEVLVMQRVKGTPGKGKIEALYSLSVWQLFRRTSAEIIPFAREQLQQDVGAALEDDLRKLVL